MHHALRGKDSSSRAKQLSLKNSLAFLSKKIQHSITAQDHQPTPDSCILSMVVGQLKADEDPIMGFHQIFLLKNINDAWVCTNDMFRLALHNFGWAGDPEAPVLFFPPLLLLILFTLTEHSKYHTQTCSTAEREQARAVTCPSAEFTLSLDEFLVHDVWKLVSCIWQEKFVLYQHASERI